MESALVGVVERHLSTTVVQALLLVRDYNVIGSITASPSSGKTVSVYVMWLSIWLSIWAVNEHMSTTVGVVGRRNYKQYTAGNS